MPYINQDSSLDLHGCLSA